MKKKAAKNDRWQGMIEERTGYLVRTIKEIKEVTEKLHENVDKKFEELKGCVDEKFEKHNTHHVNVEKKYNKWFLMIGALAVGSCLSNPESLKFVWTLLVRFIGMF